MVAVTAPQERLLIPNSHQIPNLYSDRYMAFLTSEEWKVLTYTARRMFGFNKRSDRISLSQYTSGTKSSKGEYLDHGTGLSLSAVRKALKGLIELGLITATENNKQNEGTLYSLELDEQKIQFETLQKRHEKQTKANTQKSEKARQAAIAKRKGSLSDRPPLSDNSPSVPQTPTPSVGQTPRGTVGQKHNIQGNPEETQRIHFGETLPRSPDTAHTEIKSEPVKAEPKQEPLIPESQPEPEKASGIDSAVLNVKDDMPRARDLPPVPEKHKPAWTGETKGMVGFKNTLGTQYTRHYIPKDGQTTLCHKRSFEYRGPEWTRHGTPYPDVQCGECARIVAERQAKAAARAEKAKPKYLQPPDELKDAWAKILHGGKEGMTGHNWNTLVKLWNELKCPDIEASRKFWKYWYKHDWRGIQGQRPTYGQVISLWPTAQNWTNGTPNLDEPEKKEEPYSFFFDEGGLK